MCISGVAISDVHKHEHFGLHWGNPLLLLIRRILRHSSWCYALRIPNSAGMAQVVQCIDAA